MEGVCQKLLMKKINKNTKTQRRKREEVIFVSVRERANPNQRGEKGKKGRDHSHLTPTN